MPFYVDCDTYTMPVDKRKKREFLYSEESEEEGPTRGPTSVILGLMVVAVAALWT